MERSAGQGRRGIGRRVSGRIEHTPFAVPIDARYDRSYFVVSTADRTLCCNRRRCCWAPSTCSFSRR
jgi:hypothetical protein